MSNIMIKLQTQSQKATQSLNNMGKTLGGLSSYSTKATGSFGKFQNQIQKTNNKVTNLNKDLNRTSLSLKTLSNSINIVKIAMLGNAIGDAVNKSMDMIETNNLFMVSLGNMAEKSNETVEALSKVYGLDTTNLRNAIGTYSMLAKSMGMTYTQSERLATSTTQLALELSSLTNVPINQVLADLKSGLVGQSETVYKYGIDVTEAGIKAEAMAQGITKSVRNMSQGEKVALRYSAMVRQSTLAQGDFAKTIDQPANQLKILNERMTTLSRSIGSIFIPLLGMALPYLNAMAVMLIRVADSIAKLVGFKPEEIINIDGIGNLVDDSESLNGLFDNANESARKLKNTIFGFDQFNILGKEEKSDSADSGNILDSIEIPEYNVDLNPSEKTNSVLAMFEEQLVKIKEKLEPLTSAISNLWENGLKPIQNFSYGVLSDFYDVVLVPIGNWVFGEDGLSRFINMLTQDLAKIDFNTLQESIRGLFESMTPFGEFSITSLEDFYNNFLIPIGQWVFGEDSGLNKLVTIMTNLNNNIDWGSINKSLSDFWGALSPLVTLAGDSLLWIAENILTPLIEFGINFVVPTSLNLFTELFTILTEVLSSLKPFAMWLYDSFLVPIAEWTGGVISDVLGFIVDKLKDFGNWVKDNHSAIQDLAIVIGSFMLAWKVVNLTVTIGGIVVALASFVATGGLATAVASGLSVAIGVLTSPITLVVLAIGTLISIVLLLAKNWDKVKEVGAKAWDGIKKAWEKANTWFKDNITIPIGKIFTDMWNGISKWANESWVNIKKSWEKVSKWFSDNITAPVSKFFTDMWNGLKQGGSDAWDGIKKVFSSVTDWFKEVFTNAWQGVKDVFSAGGQIFSGIKEGIESTFKTVVNGLISGINYIVSKPFSAINSMLNSIRKVSVMGFTPFQSLWGDNPLSVPQIPFLAKGGIVDDPTLAMIGEAGKEAVVPLENNTGWMREMASQIASYGGGGSMNETSMYNAVKRAVTELGGDVILRVGNEDMARATVNGIQRLRLRGLKIDI